MRALPPTGRRTARRGCGAVVLALALTACSSATGVGPAPTDGPTAATTSAAAPTDAASPAPVIEPSGPFRVDTITLRGDDRRAQVDVWIADEPELRSRGLMAREFLPAGAGMLFTYTSSRSGNFWMRDTLIPLSIAFFDGDGAVLDILDMQPCEQLPCPTYGPDRAYRYALEVPQGWFAAAGIDRTWQLDTATVPG